MLRRMYLLVCVAVIAHWACTDSVRVTHDSRSGVTISWEFKRIINNGERYTDAIMIINSANPQRHDLGLFSGDVLRVLTPETSRREMEGGTLSGFIIGTGGTGEEVLVRLNEYLGRLIIVRRRIVRGENPGAYKALKTIPVYVRTRPDAGF
jgi:hypothetical protein